MHLLITTLKCFFPSFCTNPGDFLKVVEEKNKRIALSIPDFRLVRITILAPNKNDKFWPRRRFIDSEIYFRTQTNSGMEILYKFSYGRVNGPESVLILTKKLPDGQIRCFVLNKAQAIYSHLIVGEEFHYDDYCAGVVKEIVLLPPGLWVHPKEAELLKDSELVKKFNMAPA